MPTAVPFVVGGAGVGFVVGVGSDVVGATVDGAGFVVVVTDIADLGTVRFFVFTTFDFAVGLAFVAVGLAFVAALDCDAGSHARPATTTSPTISATRRRSTAIRVRTVQGYSAQGSYLPASAFSARYTSVYLGERSLPRLASNGRYDGIPGSNQNS